MTEAATSESETQRRRLPREQRREELLDAAYETFAAMGYSAARIEDIAARAGVAKGLVLFHFGAKEALFQAVVRRVIPPMLADAEAQVEAFAGTSAALLAETLRMLHGRAAADPRARAVMRLMVAEGGKFPDLAAFYHEEVVERARLLIARVIDRGIARGEFAFAARAELPRVILGPAIFALFFQLLFSDHAALDAACFLDAHVELALRGLTPPGD